MLVVLELLTRDGRRDERALIAFIRALARAGGATEDGVRALSMDRRAARQTLMDSQRNAAIAHNLAAHGVLPRARDSSAGGEPEAVRRAVRMYALMDCVTCDVRSLAAVSCAGKWRPGHQRHGGRRGRKATRGTAAEADVKRASCAPDSCGAWHIVSDDDKWNVPERR